VLAARHQCLAKLAAQAFAAVKAQVAGPCGQAEQLFWPRRAQPLEGRRQLRRIELFAHRRLGETVRRQGGRGGLQLRRSLSIHGAQPAVLAPHHRLDRGLAAQRAGAAIAQRPAAQIHHVGLAVLGVHQVGMARTLQFCIGAMARTEDGLSGCSSYGPCRLRERAIVTPWFQPVPPSAVSR
jgi:hypothetical protein